MTNSQRRMLRHVAEGWAVIAVDGADEVLVLSNTGDDGIVVRRKTAKALLDAEYIAGDGSRVWITSAGRAALRDAGRSAGGQG